jgi:DNA primase
MPEWTTAIVVEGVFDALAINGLAVLHNTVNDEQSNLINSLRRDIIVVPDQDISGQTMISRAIEMGWAVSIPQWDHGIKDVADAVRTYGRLGALLAIMEAAHTSKIKIELMRMKLDQRIRN